jgi:hypothetical protein
MVSTSPFSDAHSISGFGLFCNIPQSHSCVSGKWLLSEMPEFATDVLTFAAFGDIIVAVH